MSCYCGNVYPLDVEQAEAILEILEQNGVLNKVEEILFKDLKQFLIDNK